jgi:hypothetical protein
MLDARQMVGLGIPIVRRADQSDDQGRAADDQERGEQDPILEPRPRQGMANPAEQDAAMGRDAGRHPRHAGKSASSVAGEGTALPKHGQGQTGDGETPAVQKIWEADGVPNAQGLAAQRNGKGPGERPGDDRFRHTARSAAEQPDSQRQGQQRQKSRKRHRPCHAGATSSHGIGPSPAVRTTALSGHRAEQSPIITCGQSGSNPCQGAD